LYVIVKGVAIERKTSRILTVGDNWGAVEAICGPAKYLQGWRSESRVEAQTFCQAISISYGRMAQIVDESPELAGVYTLMRAWGFQRRLLRSIKVAADIELMKPANMRYKALAKTAVQPPPLKVGERVFALNPLFTDGTRLRVDAASDAEFNGQHVLNDDAVEILELKNEFARIHVVGAQVGGKPVEGWMRERNLSRRKRGQGLAPAPAEPRTSEEHKPPEAKVTDEGKQRNSAVLPGATIRTPGSADSILDTGQSAHASGANAHGRSSVDEKLLQLTQLVVELRHELTATQMANPKLAESSTSHSAPVGSLDSSGLEA